MENGTMSKNNNEEADRQKLSRAHAEELCLLDAVGAGATLEELTERLGLPTGLSAAVKEAVGSLVEAEWVVQGEEAYRCSEKGERQLAGWDCGS
jgi:hypothetical protein